MKIIYISNTRIPTEKAHGYQISKMCESLAVNGAEVELWLPSRKNNSKLDIFETYNLKTVFKTVYLRVPDFLSHGGSFQKAFYIFQTALFLISVLLKNIHGSVVYTRNPEIVFLCALRGERVIFEDHGWPNRRIWLYLFFVKRASLVVAITSCIKNKYEENCKDLAVIVAPDAVDLDHFTVQEEKMAIRERLMLPKDKKIVMYTGSFYLYAWKGIDVLLEASKSLPDEYLVVLVGANEMEFNNLSKDTKSSKVLIVTRKLHKEIPFYLKASDVLVLPNKKGDITSECYTSPLKLFEYMASGVPIVASKLPSIEEVLTDENSCLVEPNNAVELAKGIQRICTDRVYAEQISKEARVDVLRHTWLSRAEKILESLQSSKL